MVPNPTAPNAASSAAYGSNTYPEIEAALTLMRMSGKYTEAELGARQGLTLLRAVVDIRDGIEKPYSESGPAGTGHSSKTGDSETDNTKVIAEPVPVKKAPPTKISMGDYMAWRKSGVKTYAEFKAGQDAAIELKKAEEKGAEDVTMEDVEAPEDGPAYQ